MVEGPHCYAFFEGNDAFAARGDSDMTAFYLTDFLVRQFDAFVWRPMGLGPPSGVARHAVGNYTKLVYQAQTDDPGLLEKARSAPRGWAGVRAPPHRLRRSGDGPRGTRLTGASAAV